jgi:glycosyltransferase involved in cell wall biosynthesis
MCNIKTSVIIPVFNSEAFLIKCLNSVIQQTYQNLEVILVNDGSTDNSSKIIDDYAAHDSRIKAIHKSNGGIGSAYKVAFQEMTGDYVLFVDSDDWLELNAVEELVKLAVEHDADLVSFGIRAFNTSGNEVNLPTLLNLDQINTTNEAILKTHFEILKHPTLVRLYKRHLFKDIVIFEQNIGIDEMLTPQLLAKCNKAVYTSRVFYNIITRPNSVSRAEFSNKKILETLKVYNFLINFAGENLPHYKHFYYEKYINVIGGILHGLFKKNTDNLLFEEVYRNFKNIYREFMRIKQLKNKFNFSQKIRYKTMADFPIIYKLLVKL